MKNPKRVIMVVFDEFPDRVVPGRTGKSTPLSTRTSLGSRRGPPGTATTRPSRPTRNGRYPRSSPGGCRPQGNVVPSYADYPQNLFTLLRGVYPLNVHEAVTRLCPRSTCSARATDASGLRAMKLLGGDALKLWRTFASPKPEAMNFSEDSVVQYGVPQMQQFVDSLKSGPGPQLDFVHIELPHEPWHLLPTLQDTQHLAPAAGCQQVDLAERTRGRPRVLVVSICCRCRRPTRCSARSSTGRGGRRVEGLDGRGDRGSRGRRSGPARESGSVTKEGPATTSRSCGPRCSSSTRASRQGVVDDRPVQSIDMLPTIADVIKAKIPWKIDGKSLPRPAATPTSRGSSIRPRANSVRAARGVVPGAGSAVPATRSGRLPERDPKSAPCPKRR